MIALQIFVGMTAGYFLRAIYSSVVTMLDDKHSCKRLNSVVLWECEGRTFMRELVRRVAMVI